MDHISFQENSQNRKNATEVARALHSARKEDPEFQGVPTPTEEEAAHEIEKRIEELRAFIRGQ